MQKKPHLLFVVIASSLIFPMLFSLAYASKSGSVSTETSETTATSTLSPEQTPSPSPTPSPALTMEQKKAMVWMGDNYESCYPMDVFVFSGTVNGGSRLIWTCLEDKQSHRTYSHFEPVFAPELFVYDLINREYLFTLSFPKDSLQPNPWEFYKYITDCSPALGNASLNNSESLFHLEEQYELAGIDSTEIQNVTALINSYIYVEPQSISPWDKSRAIEAYCAVTPEDYILPYWEYIPNAVQPANLDSIDASAATPLPAVEYTQEQKEFLLGGKPILYPMTIGDLDVFFIKVNGNMRIIWTTNYRNLKDSDDEFYAVDHHSAFNDEYLFTLRIPYVDFESGLLASDIWKYYFKSSAQLEELKLLGSGSILDLSMEYSSWGIPYAGNERIDSLASAGDKGDYSVVDIPVSQEEIEELYLDTVPDAYIMPFWEYVLNAVTPDAFLTPTPISAATPAP